MPHEFWGFPFTEQIGGKFEVMPYHTQQQVDTLLPPEHKSAFEVIKSIMIAGDKLAAFTTTPVPDQ
jgi:hypothetical protein